MGRGRRHWRTNGRYPPQHGVEASHVSHMTSTGGHHVVTRTKFITMASAAKMPNAPIGITGEMAVAKKATAVVNEVVKTDPAARRHVTAIRRA